MSVELLPPTAQRYDIGRAVILRAPYWDGSYNLLDDSLLDDDNNPIGLVHLGNTEGEIAPQTNYGFSVLTLPENTGDAPVEMNVSGAAPSWEVGLFVNPDQLDILSPTGSGSGGTSMHVRAQKHTVWVVAEELFKKYGATGIPELVAVTLTGGVWDKDGDAFTAEDQRLFDLSRFYWRVVIEDMGATYRSEDAGRSLRQVKFTPMIDFTKPEGHMIWTCGRDLTASGIDLEGGS